MRRVTKLSSVVGVTAALALTATACGGTTADKGPSKKKGAAIAYDIGGRGDQSFNDAAYAGLAKAEKKYGFKGQDVEPSEGEADADKLNRLNELARQGYSPVIGVGFAYAAAVKKAAKENPKTTFGLIDDDTVKAKNVANLVFHEEQGSYLAGVAAAKTTKSKTIGFVGGVQVPLIQKFEAGFLQGVRDTDKSVKVKKQYLTQPPNTDGFSKPDLGKEAAKGQLDAGADVIYHAAGLSGQGVIEAAAGRKKWVIGVDSDQYKQKTLAKYKKYILTSMTKDVSDSVFKLIQSVQDGKPQSGVQRYSLAENGVGLATSNPEFMKMKSVQDAVAKAKKDIVDGKIKVATKP
ncbi:BMP family ABC transporter substrate-binding protein [Streptomyces sp. ODS28]|uniref:BMP family lipoprotein n=1 Tax=Streptomyces sp. ODS28 TaxID=3136688 RepID=UPI0031EAE383